jgi:Ca2+-binding RTX toxin-like protein
MAAIRGTDNSEVLFGTNSNDSIYTLGGNDSVVAGLGSDIVDLGTGNDYVRLDLGIDTVIGGSGNDEVVLSSDGGIVYADEGDDTIRGNIGTDRVSGGAGNDFINTGTGGAFEEVFSDAGNDTIEVGLSDSVYISAGSGNDTVRLLAGTKGTFFGTQNHFYHGGDGVDTLEVNPTIRFINGGLSATGVSVDLKSGFVSTGLGFASISGFEAVRGTYLGDTITGSDGADTLRAGDGADSVRGGLGNDFIMGEAGNDNLSGEDGNDIIYAGAGNDYVSAGAGNDTIIGGAGRDTMTGGLGDDDFVFSAQSDAGLGSNADVITDFQIGRDDLDLSQLGDIAWIGNNSFSGTAGEARQSLSGSNTIVEIDVNGDGVRDMHIRLMGITAGLLESDLIT